ncbi:sulfatase-like hydrolase/transferase [Vibrio sp. WXL103]|uniref:sulfatase-like hydrolase/transferase n=1 Tax=unclassified Vibrio TaxID=2614977 RepID=UPI003EC65FC7
MKKTLLVTSMQLLFVLPTLSGCSDSNNLQASAETFKAKPAAEAEAAPNILWIITDDHRPDSISAYNQAVFGTKNSPLGYVESPYIDQLAAEGTLFTTAFSNSPVCGPTRGSMATGRYPFRNGHYAFELTHQAPDFITPTVSQTLRDAGYQTSVYGKEDAYIFRWGPGQGFHEAGLFDYKVHFKHDLQKNFIGDLFTEGVYDFNDDGVYEMQGTTENVVYPDGTTKSYFLKRAKGAPLTEEDLRMRAEVDEEFELLRAYTRGNQNLILGGENPQPAEETVDAYIVKEFKNYLENADKKFETSWGKTAKGADTSKPQYMQLGFHLPHTPVLPPKSYRDRFKQHTYNIPAYDRSETALLPDQLQKIQRAGDVYPMTYDEKQQAIQDYYAFCAHGDNLIGEAVEAFKKYSEDNGQEWLIVFAIGDHGWHLGEQGMNAKFGPWIQSTANAAIVVSSDKSLVPAGKVYSDIVEYVDFAPTVLTAAGLDVTQDEFDYLDGYNLIDVYHENLPKRDYALGEVNVISGPRAYLHTERFRFSMRTRPFNNWVNESQLGKDLDWALTTTPEKAEMTLYDLDNDPLEQINVAYDENYAALADWFRNKLGNIVLGDGRVEADWSKENSYHISNFAEGADDKVADIPAELIPAS